MADAANRAAFHAAVEFLFRPGEQFHHAGAAQAVALVEIGHHGALGELVPRADGLAIVAAVHLVADQGPHLDGNGALQLDRQVGNAAARVELVRPQDGLRRAHRDARRALAATRRFRRVHGQRHVDEDLAKEKEGTALAVDQQGMLAAPAQASLLRQFDFHHGRRIAEDAVTEVADLALDALGQLLQARTHDLVIVAAPRIHGNHGCRRIGVARRLVLTPVGPQRRRQIIHARADGAHRARHQFGRARTLHAVAGHVVHFAVVPCIDPGLQGRFHVRQIHVGDAHLGKTQLAPPLFNGARQDGEIGDGGGHRGLYGKRQARGRLQ